MKNIIIYGGTFDPPHYGHLNTARAVQNNFHFDRFVFLPCKTPVLKDVAVASSAQRVSMLKLALEDYPEFEIDLREITRSTPSFMVETLESFHQSLDQNTAVTLCLGSDAFMQLPQWHSWQKILELSNILVIKRAQNPFLQTDDSAATSTETIKTLLLNHETFDKNTLLTQPFGKIYRFDAGQYLVSSSWLRQQLKAGNNIDTYLPKKVYLYIKAQALYP